MPKVIVSADVANGAEWEGLFRTHGDLFQKQRVTNIDFAIDGNHVVCCFDTEDLDTYMQHFQSEETAAAMIEDGVDRDSVSVHVLDRNFRP